MRIISIFLYSCIFTHLLSAELLTTKVKNGVHKKFYDNGQVRLQVEYVHGQKHHIQNLYYRNGQLSTQVNYIMGKREGLMKEWDINGFKSSEVFYVSNYKVGLKKFFDNTGKVSFIQEFKINRNPLIVELLKDKQEEILMNLAKYDLLPKKMY